MLSKEEKAKKKFIFNKNSRIIHCSMAHYLRFVESSRLGFWIAFPEFFIDKKIIKFL